MIIDIDNWIMLKVLEEINYFNFILFWIRKNQSLTIDKITQKNI